MSPDDILTSEAAIIGEFLAPLTQGDAGACGLEDDCAVLAPEPGTDLVLTTDSLVEGVHFLAGDVPAFKALAVNVSDLIAKGAVPRAYLMNLTLPSAPTRGFMQLLVEGLAEAQVAFGCHLVGGDIDRTPGPFAITITAIGAVPAGRAVRRSGARAGDVVVVTGSIGGAALGLRLQLEPLGALAGALKTAEWAHLVARFERPRPRLASAALVRDFASAAMDVSDGLAKDLERLAQASGVMAEAQLAAVPVSAAAGKALGAGLVDRQALIAGGEDYEVLMTVPQARLAALEAAAVAAGVAVTVIGRIEQGSGIVWRDEDGRAVPLARTGWDHF